MVTSKQIKAEIQERFGFFPPFFEPAQETPEVLANLWQQTLSAYINNPLPALFKEKLFAYLSRYCSVPYCVICHSCALSPLGMTAKEVLALLEESALEIATDVEAQISILQSHSQPLTAWPEPNSTLERSLYRASILIFLRPYHAEHYRTLLRRLLGTANYTHLVTFLAYVKMCHQWIECHPEVSSEADRRAQLNLAPLLEEAPELADFFKNYKEKVQQEKENWENEVTKQIIKLQQVEKAWQETENKCQLLVNSVKDVIFQTDLTGNWIFLNQAWFEITGFSTQESLGTDFINYIHPDDRQRNLEEFQALMENRKELSCHEVRYLTKKGDCRWLEVNAIANGAIDGKIIGTSGTLRDISDRKAAEIALHESNSILSAVIEGTTDAVFVKDLQGRYILANSAVARIQGRPIEAIIGRDDTELLSRETALKLMETDRRIMSSGQPEVLEEIATINNITRTYLSTKNVYRDREGNIIGVIGISRDISDRKQLELEREQLIEQLTREREDLAALSLVTANAISTLNLDELLNVLLRRIVQVLGANTAVILLKEGASLRVRATIGIDEELCTGFAVPIGQGFAGTIAASCQPLYIEDAQNNPLIVSQIVKQTNIRTMLGVPLKRNGTLVGVLHVDWSQIHPFSDREVHLLEITAERCAMAILNAQLFEETKQLKERLQLQIDRMPIGCILHDRDCRFIDWNPAAERIFGFTKQEVLGRHPRDVLIPSSVRPQVDKILRRLSAGDLTANSINENITKDGRTIICEWNNTPLKKADGSFIGILSMVQDITERKQAEEALQESEERFRQMAENIGEVFWMANLELSKILYVNPAYEEIWGRSCQSLYEQPSSFIKAIHPDDRQRVATVFLKQRQLGFNLEYRIVRPDGSVRWISERAFPVRDSKGRPYRLVGVSRDITERKQAEDALRESERRYHTLAKMSPVGIFRTNAQGKWRYVNERWCEIGGLTLEESLGEGWAKALHPGDRERFLREWNRTVSEKLPFQSECRALRPDGTITWIFAQAVPELGETGEVLGFVGTLTDITDRKQAEEQLRRYAFYDPLTGLPNRTLLLKQLKQTIELAKGNQNSLFAVLLLDLDRFQTVKFSLGHQFADRLLIATAYRLETCFASLSVEGRVWGIDEETTTSDTWNSTPQFMVAQVGLDEFAIVLSNLREVGDVTRIADEICQELTKPFNLEGQEVFINASIGIALSSINYDQPEDYLRAADTAMHQSKKLRRAGYAVFEPKWQTNAVERLHLEADLRRAIERQELRVYYQPIVSLTNNRIAGFEALVRWQHPIRGLVPPGDFIPLAEETGLIILIDRWVLREACRQIVIWQHTFPSNQPLTIAANLSAIQLGQSDLIVQIEQILRETGINPKSLKLEITESSLQENTSSEKAMLEQLKGLGVELAIDDFGTGYSSLARLHQMPIDKLKIDRSFINQMGVDSESLEFVRTIVRLAHVLNLDVIAEGVETAEQLANLKDLQCEYGQGFFFSKPVDADTAEASLTASNNEEESRSFME